MSIASQLRAIETTDLERRLAKLEKPLAKTDGGPDGDWSAPVVDLGNLPSPRPEEAHGVNGSARDNQTGAGEEPGTAGKS